ncbi:glycosyltransferase, partial [Actinomyces radicidentis]|uniref:glycosyltransferase n=1 Tax=Actinomyces radicidentis TaxID=111015 RepID=UPI0026E09528
TALGLPALYVPLPIGNGEQRLNAADVVAAGGGRLVADGDLVPADVAGFATELADDERRKTTARAAASTGVRDGAARLAALVRATAQQAQGASASEQKKEKNA